MNKFMRMLVFFDLPVVTAKEKKDAAKFRKFLLKDGYNMVQWSVYSRICNGMDAAKISDTPGKGMCKNPDYVDYLNRCIDYRMKNDR